MGLTEAERNQLHEIGAKLAVEDPQLARQLTGHGSIGFKPRRAALLVIGGSTVVLASGAVLRVPAMCVSAWIAMLAGIIAAVFVTKDEVW